MQSEREIPGYTVLTYPNQLSWLRKNLPVGLPVQHIPPQLVIPLQQIPLEASVTAEEEIASSRLSLEEEIDQFRFAKDVEPFEKPVDISDSETESVDISSVHPRQLIITQVDSESEEEKEQMDQKKRPSLKGLLASRNKREKFQRGPQNTTPSNSYSSTFYRS